MKFLGRSFLSSALLLLLFSSISHSAEISISASVDKNKLSLDDQIVLEVNVSGNVSNIPNPSISDLPNFTVYSSGRSQNISIINGQMSSSVSFHYTLVPKSTGKFTIPPITLSYTNKTYSTSPIEIEVTASGVSQAQATPQGIKPSGGQIPGTGNIKNIFVTASLDRNTAYINEQVVFTFRFYRRVQLLSNPQYNAPDFTSFWTEDTPPKNYQSTVNGVNYLVSEVKTLLFPTKSGKFEIPAATLTCNIEDFSRNDPFADDFFSGFFSTGKTQALRTSPLSLTVKPLPESGKPGDFKGAVGNFKISGSVDKTSVKAGEAVTLTVTVSGSGNIKSLPEPLLSNILNFRKYETVNSMDIDSSQGTLRGSKTFKTILVPEVSGQKTISPISYSFFDPIRNKYITEKTTQLYIEVKPGEARASASYPGLKASQGEIKVINQDIEYIKPLEKWKNYSGHIYEKPGFFLANIIPALALFASFIYLKWKEKITSDVSFARRLRASKTARKYLRQAKALMSREKSFEYYGSISRAILEYIGHKLNVSAEGLTLNIIEGLLLEKKISTETISGIKQLLEESDMARFSPATVTDEMVRNTYLSAERMIEMLEKELH